MSVIKCRRCGHRASSEARLCPVCGAKAGSAVATPRPKRFKNLTFWGLGLLFVSALVVGLASYGRADRLAHEETVLASLRNACQIAWEGARQRQLNDPGSLQWELSLPERGNFEGRPAVFLRYRAMNAYGGFTMQQAICEIDPRTGRILQVLE